MEIHEATTTEWSSWDGFLDRTAGTSPFARSGWLAALERAYGVPTMIFLASAEGEVRGGCACYVVRDVHGTQALYSLRHGFVATDDAVAVVLADAVSSFARERGITRVLIAAGMRQYAIDTPPIARETVVFPIAASEAVQWDALRNKTRNMVRKAQRAGCVVRDGGSDRDGAAFHRIYARRMLAKGVPVHAREFFTAALTAVPGTSLLIVEREERMIGGLLLCIGEHSAAYPYQAATPGADRFAPTPLLVWEALRRCAARGTPLLDMGESTPGSSVHAAKVHFGGEPRTVHNYQFFDGALRTSVRTTALIRAATLGMRYAPSWVGARCGVWLRQHGRLM